LTFPRKMRTLACSGLLDFPTFPSCIIPHRINYHFVFSVWFDRFNIFFFLPDFKWPWPSPQPIFCYYYSPLTNPCLRW